MSERLAVHARTLRRGARVRSLRAVVLSVVGVVGAIATWHLVAELEVVSRFMLPAPMAVLDAFLALIDRPYQGSTLWGHTRDSLSLALLGWALAGLIGLPVGVMAGWSKRVSDAVMPLFNLIRPIPPIAWIPIVIIWLGVGTSARAVVVFLSAWVPWVLNSSEAVRSVDHTLVKAARNLGASDRTILQRVVLPTALPMLMTGGRIALGNAWMTLIAAELLAASSGLGFIALNARRTFDTAIMIVAMGVIGVLGALISLVFRAVERHFASWSSQPVGGS
jgi:ABC-type nitrate/sulfonate/bicarbonate transport system permease component